MKPMMKPMVLNTLLSCLIQPGRFLHSARSQGSGKHPSAKRLSEKGLTLLECVVAIAVIALTGAMIGPPLVMAAATRVQNRRAEQSMQIAQGEVDRIRAIVARGGANIDLLPPLVNETALKNHPAPTSKLSGVLKSPDDSAGCGNYNPTNTSHVPNSSQVLQVDINGQDDNCSPDFLVQTFRQNLDTTNGVRDFQLMVRVYSIKAADHFNNLKEEEAGLGFTTADGSYWQKPLTVLTTRINQSDTDAALCGYHGLNSNGNATDCS